MTRQMGLAVAAVALALASCRPAGRSGALDPSSVSVEVGTGGLVSRGRWNRVVVKARAKDAVFKGEAVITGRVFPDSEERFRAPFEAAREEQSVELLFRPVDWDEIVVSLAAPGVPAHATRAPLGFKPEERFGILGISERIFAAGDLTDHAKKWLAGIGFAGRADQFEIAVGSVSPDRLPASFLGYDAADLVVLDRTALAGADPARVEALREWVRRGGTIAAVPGPEWISRAPPAVLELFGLEAPLEERPPAADEPASASRYRIRAATGAEPSLREARYGSGRAFLFLYAPTGALPAAWKDEQLSRSLLRDWGRVIRASGRSRDREPGGMVAQTAQPVLVRFSGFHYPPRETVLVFFLVYLGLGFGLIGWILKRKGRLEWLYPIMLVLSIASGIGIYRFGLLSAIREPSVGEVTIARVRPGSSTADAVSFVGVSSPTSRIASPKFPGLAGGAVPSQLNTYDFRPSNSLPLDYHTAGGAVEIPELELYPNASRMLRFDYALDLGGPISARRAAGGAITVENGSRYPLKFVIPEGPGESGILEVAAGGRADLPSIELKAGPGDRRSDNLISAEQLRAHLRAALESSVALVAEVEAPLFPGQGLGPVQRSLNYAIIEVEDDG